MREQDVRDGLTDALADEPPLSFDPDQLVARAQREIRRRRSLVGVGGATAVIAVAAVVAATLLHPATPGKVAASVPPLNTAPTTTTVTGSNPPPNFQWPPTGIHPKVYSAAEEDALDAGWIQHLTQTFATVVPGASQVTIQKISNAAIGNTSGLYYDGIGNFVRFRVHGVPAAVGIELWGPGQLSRSPAQSCALSTRPNNCVFTRTADGGLLLYYDIANTQHLRSVTDFRPDGTVVSVTGYNYDPTGAGPPAGPRSIPVTDAQLTTIAIDPVLAF